MLILYLGYMKLSWVTKVHSFTSIDFAPLFVLSNVENRTAQDCVSLGLDSLDGGTCLLGFALS